MRFRWKSNLLLKGLRCFCLREENKRYIIIQRGSSKWFQNKIQRSHLEQKSINFKKNLGTILTKLVVIMFFEIIFQKIKEIQNHADFKTLLTITHISLLIQNEHQISFHM